VYFLLLQVLDCSNNVLFELPEEVKQLTQLQILDISNNQFFEFPKTAISIRNIIKLVFSQENGMKVSALYVYLEGEQQ
jgi:Leucine-rich repeat (LRR) protein